ncbi:hypothetical protein [Pseudonocardia nigra]|uniref:hypothetical protein n=1 Tax=Pseudonocardia nigra TaxID=1921578 RepID=UPI001C5FF4CF|nr:hypothetical protein [Pseudonocardia nigra]
MATPMIDLAARTSRVRVLRRIGWFLLALVVAGCLAALVASRDPLPVRLAAGGFAVLVVLVCLFALLTRNRRPRWLGIDHEGVRIVDRRGRVITRVAWGDLAGVGVMTNEFARLRQRLGRVFTGGSRAMISVPIWLELFPASEEAVRRHPELRAARELGARSTDREQRWLIMLGDGHGQELPVAEHVQRRRPELWRGHRLGSPLFGPQTWIVGREQQG